MSTLPVTAEEYAAALAEHRVAEEAWKALEKAELDARKACDAAREGYYARCRAFKWVKLQWKQQQPLSGVERNWLTRLSSKPRYIGGWRHQESSKTEDRMRELGFAGPDAKGSWLVLSELGKTKLAEAPGKKTRKR